MKNDLFYYGLSFMLPPLVVLFSNNFQSDKGIQPTITRNGFYICRLPLIFPDHFYSSLPISQKFRFYLIHVSALFSFSLYLFPCF